MIHSRPSSSHLLRLAVAAVMLVAATAWPASQGPARKSLRVDDDTRWRGVASAEISRSGEWVAPKSMTDEVPFLKKDENREPT